MPVMSAAPRDFVDTNSTHADMFKVVMRGYDREQVHEHIQVLLEQLDTERHRVEVTQQELRRARNDRSNGQQPADAEGTNSFGVRVEKIMRMAEHEAAQSRHKAADDAAALMEKARAEAEARRQDVEQQLITRAANLDQEAARRYAAIQEREAEVVAELEAAKQRAEELRSDAEREAERVRLNAEAMARELRSQAEKAAQQQCDLAAREVSHLGKVQDKVSSEIRRLHEMLAAELGLASDRTDADPNRGAIE